MRIVQFIDTLRSGGKERQLVELLTGLSKVKEIECELVIMSKEIHYSYYENLNIKPYFLIRNGKKDPRIFYHLYKLCKTIRPDIIHSWSSMCSIYAIPIAKLLRIKFINGFLRNAPPTLNIFNPEWIRAKLTFPLSDKILANSFAGLKAYNVPVKKSICIHNGFNFDRINNLADKKSIKEKYSIKTELVVGMVATFSNNKDYATFIKAAQMVLESSNDVTFIAVGDGDNLEGCKNLVKPEFQDRIKFFGRQKDVESIVNIFDIGVLATFTEGISNVIMEYMALGKPVIATDCGGNRELVKEGETGFLVNAADPLEIAQKTTLLLENKEMANDFGRNGEKRLRTKFNLEKMGNEFESLYREIKG